MSEAKNILSVATTLTQYDYDCADEVYETLFRKTEYETEDGLTEIPAASYQLVVSALELMLWDVHGPDHDTLNHAIGIVEYLRDKQKHREWARRPHGYATNG